MALETRTVDNFRLELIGQAIEVTITDKRSGSLLAHQAGILVGYSIQTDLIELVFEGYPDSTTWGPSRFDHKITVLVEED